MKIGWAVVLIFAPSFTLCFARVVSVRLFYFFVFRHGDLDKVSDRLV